MKRPLFAAAVAGVAIGLALPPTFAADPASGATPQLTTQGAGVMSQAPHYEWQYHYVGHHQHFEGHWVLVR